MRGQALPPRQIGELFADQKRILQIVYNLVINAIEHTAPSGRIVTQWPFSMTEYARRTGLPGTTPTSITTLAALEKELDKVRRHGVARALGRPIPGVNAFSAAAFDHEGRPALVITAGGVKMRSAESYSLCVAAAVLTLIWVHHRDDVAERTHQTNAMQAAVDWTGVGQVLGRGVRRRRVILRGDGSGGQCRRHVLLFGR